MVLPCDRRLCLSSPQGRKRRQPKLRLPHLVAVVDPEMTLPGLLFDVYHRLLQQPSSRRLTGEGRGGRRRLSTTAAAAAFQLGKVRRRSLRPRYRAHRFSVQNRKTATAASPLSRQRREERERDNGWESSLSPIRCAKALYFDLYARARVCVCV